MPRIPKSYQNTVMYKIICNDLNITDCYVGHTTNFQTRYRNHKSSCKNSRSKDHNFKIYQIIRENGGWENWSMKEIEKFPCGDANEARARERFWYEYFVADLNENIPNRTIKEYKDEYKEKYKEYFQQYREINKAYIKNLNKAYYEANKDEINKRTREKRKLNKIKNSELKSQEL